MNTAERTFPFCQSLRNFDTRRHECDFSGSQHKIIAVSGFIANSARKCHLNLPVAEYAFLPCHAAALPRTDDSGVMDGGEKVVQKNFLHDLTSMYVFLIFSYSVILI